VARAKIEERVRFLAREVRGESEREADAGGRHGGGR
jgi:hypothetical protein